MDYVYAVLALIIGVIGVFYLRKNKEGKVSNSLNTNLLYWQFYLGSGIMILLGVLWILKLSGVIIF